MHLDEVFIHPSSEISPQAVIGQGTRIWQHCTVLAGAIIGENCMLSQNVFIEGRTRLGNHVKVKNNVSIYELVELEDDVFVGPSVVFTNVLNPRSRWPRKHEFKPTLVKKGASIGANATIVCGITIGRYAMVGAGSVVTRDVIDHALVYGNPARQHGWVCECGEMLPKDPGASYTCPVCGTPFTATQPS
jgi:UDP-2-acetamido-3-amino-2,3-dideoxy-glucuronate N-acetyltransferase